MHTSNRALTLSWRTSLSIRSANQCTGFYRIGTSVMKELRRSSPIILRKSFLKCYKADFIFFIFFSIWIFFFMNIHTSQDNRGRGKLSLYIFFYHFHSLHIHLDISGFNALEGSPLEKGGSQIRNVNLWFSI